MIFHGRKQELAELKSAYSTDNFEGILVYGRRRIGKTELIKESIRDFSGKMIYYEAKLVSEQSNLASFSEIIGAAYGIPQPNFPSFEKAVEFVFTRAADEKTILIIDEYPYLREKIEGCDSIFQSVIDRHINSANLKLILCGSYIGTMVKLTQDSNPLFGRFSHKLKINQLDYYESAEFYPSFSPEDKVALYSVFGGIPYFLQFIDENISVKENIISLIASPQARLLSEIEQTLTGEIRKISNANEVFSAVAAGYKKFADILSHSHVSSSPTLADILRKLCEMEIIEKTYPINDEREKKSIYTISDRLTLFYFRYIYRHLSYFAVMNPEDFYNEFIEENFLRDFVPHCYEIIARQFLVRQNKAGKIRPVLYNIGKFYYDDPKNKCNGEFDLVTVSRDGYDFYEVKFTDKPVSDAVVNEEISQLEKAGVNANKLGFFSKSGFQISEMEKYILYDIKDVYDVSRETFEGLGARD